MITDWFKFNKKIDDYIYVIVFHGIVDMVVCDKLDNYIYNIPTEFEFSEYGDLDNIVNIKNIKFFDSKKKAKKYLLNLTIQVYSTSDDLGFEIVQIPKYKLDAQKYNIKWIK